MELPQALKMTKQSEDNSSDILTNPIGIQDETQDEELPLELNSTNDAESHQAIIEYINDNLDGNCEFRKILNHTWYYISSLY